MTTKFRLIPGSYKGFDGNEYEYYQYVQFYSARTQKSFVSSGQYQIDGEGRLEKVGGNCLGWDEWQREVEEGIDRNSRTVSLRVMHAFNGIHLDWYHLVPVFDDNNQPMLYQNGKRKGEQIRRKELCAGRKCEMCKDKLEKVFGKKVHWSIGMGHLECLGGIIEEIAKDCTNCNGHGTIEKITWDCEGCGKPIVICEDFDLRNENQAKEYHNIVDNVFPCKCGNTGTLLAQHECSGCKDPAPLSIFDCDLEIKRQGEDTKSVIQVPRWTPTELSDELKEMAEPWNLAEIFFPDPLDIQAKILKVKNPYGKDGAAAGREEHAKDYANYQE